jgi:sugar lactone lactonase YvrE
MRNTLFFTALAVIASGQPGNADGLKYGDTLFRITLPDGYTATVFNTGINGVDGLVFSSSGYLYAVSEGDGVVYRIDRSGNATIFAEGLANPEGIAVDSLGSIYVTEDVEYGRLIKIEPSGNVEILADSLHYPEGVAWMEDGDLAVTESSLEAISLPPVLTGVLRIDVNGSSPLFSSLYLWSCSDLIVDSSGMLYVCNELSGYGFIQASLLRIDPLSGEWEVFCRGLHACEGICCSADGFFPMYVAEEDIGTGSGRLSLVDENGTAAVFAQGFYNIEDVAVDTSGGIYVSEDTTGMIILIRRED